MAFCELSAIPVVCIVICSHNIAYSLTLAVSLVNLEPPCELLKSLISILLDFTATEFLLVDVELDMMALEIPTSLNAIELMRLSRSSTRSSHAAP